MEVSSKENKNSQEMKLFSDGASKGNPGPGGWGALVIKGGIIVELGDRESNVTNNQMELRAAIEGLKVCLPTPCSIVVYTDSKYLINGVRRWIHSWKKNGWKTKENKEVLNRSSWEELNSLVYSDHSPEIRWVHVAGHSGIPGNERVDKIATDFALGKSVELYQGSIDQYSISLTSLLNVNSGNQGESRFPRYLSFVDNRVDRHRTWEECQKRVQGRSGAKFKKVKTPYEEEETLKKWNYIK